MQGSHCSKAVDQRTVGVEVKRQADTRLKPRKLKPSLDARMQTDTSGSPFSLRSEERQKWSGGAAERQSGRSGSERQSGSRAAAAHRSLRVGCSLRASLRGDETFPRTYRPTALGKNGN
ncbi:unnamed protein product [Gadus morhua 'NCC']